MGLVIVAIGSGNEVLSSHWPSVAVRVLSTVTIRLDTVNVKARRQPWTVARTYPHVTAVGAGRGEDVTGPDDKSAPLKDNCRRAEGRAIAPVHRGAIKRKSPEGWSYP